MARNTKTVVITAKGRDQGKAFFLEEMPPRQSEKWAIRFGLAMSKTRADLDPEEIAANGWAAIISTGLRSMLTMTFDDAEPLLDEMLTTVWFIPDQSRIDQNTKRPFVRPVNWDDDVEEALTLATLRSEVIELHTGFSPAAFLSTLGAAAKLKLNSSDTQTSPPPSD